MKKSKIVVVVRAVFKFNSKYLLINQTNASGKNYLLFPGGHVEINESLPDALRREVSEELNIDSFIISKLAFVKETASPFDRNYEFFFECKTSMKSIEVSIKQTGFFGFEKLKSCLLLKENELKKKQNFYPKNYFSKSRYQILELDLDQYKKRFGNDINIQRHES